MHETPYAFSDEVLNGFKKMFGKFFGTNHLVREGWLSYQVSMQVKPQPDGGVGICFHSGAMVMFKTMLEMGEAGMPAAMQMNEENRPENLWEGFRNSLADEIDAELLDQYKKAFYGGCWFISALWFTTKDEDEQRAVEIMAALRDEISKFRINIKQWLVSEAKPRPAYMFLEFDDLLVRGEKQELFKQCFNRCYAAVSVSYEFEKQKCDAFWRFDERFHEQGIEILYERFAYAMAMIADRFHKDCVELYDDLAEAQKKGGTFATFLSGSVDEVFNRSIRDMGFDHATLAYYEEDYLDEAYDEFWDSHKELKAQVIAVRNSFDDEERTFLHGFSDNDRDTGDLETDNRDCLHMMRICKRWQKVDVEKFLTATKREYLPMMIKLFIAKPKEDIFADKPSAK
jgi:hypothetical protein